MTNSLLLNISKGYFVLRNESSLAQQEEWMPDADAPGHVRLLAALRSSDSPSPWYMFIRVTTGISWELLRSWTLPFLINIPIPFLSFFIRKLK